MHRAHGNSVSVAPDSTLDSHVVVKCDGHSCPAATTYWVVYLALQMAVKGIETDDKWTSQEF